MVASGPIVVALRQHSIYTLQIKHLSLFDLSFLTKLLVEKTGAKDTIFRKKIAFLTTLNI